MLKALATSVPAGNEPSDEKSIDEVVGFKGPGMTTNSSLANGHIVPSISTFSVNDPATVTVQRIMWDPNIDSLARYTYGALL